MELAALWIALGGTAAAVASAVVAWFARGDSLRAQVDANAAADRATKVSERSLVIQESAFQSPPWSFEWWSGDTFLLTNTSSVDALDVVISSAPDGLGLRIGMDCPGMIGARSAVKVMYAATMADPWARDIVVAWRRPDSQEPLTWRFPIPSRPRD
ncbi:hypothetical protein [Leucobacter chironomi]|uniref:hypothetical protein n=1 Tax=Leucobacter chironomi TaxID=491918 RepID=UPI0012684202|nr:hypothetical protein [Leucobacter chironomi]